MAFISRRLRSLIKNTQRNKQEQQNQQVEQEQQLEDLGLQNVSQAGYKKFADLIAAKKKKEQELMEGRQSRVSGIGSLMGRNTLLG